MEHETDSALRQPDPTEEDKLLLDEIVKRGLGEQAVGRFFGAMVKGVKGDEAHYGHAVIVSDPNYRNYKDNLEEYYDRLALVAKEIGNNIEVAGNVILDLTPEVIVEQ